MKKKLFFSTALTVLLLACGEQNGAQEAADNNAVATDTTVDENLSAAEGSKDETASADSMEPTATPTSAPTPTPEATPTPEEKTTNEAEIADGAAADANTDNSGTEAAVTETPQTDANNTETTAPAAGAKRIKQVIYYFQNVDANYYTVYDYDANGNKTGERSYDVNNVQMPSAPYSVENIAPGAGDFSYNPDGSISEVIVFDEYGDPVFIADYEYY